MEVLSIHIPKTAGSSLFQVFRKTYGKEGVLRVYGMRGAPETIDMSLFPGKDVENVKVLHGHFFYSQLKHIIQEFNPHLITWLREPVDRLISNYYYTMYRIREGLAKPEKLYIRDFSLIEYAEMEENRNMMSYFLDGSDLKDFFFIGLKENFEEDLKKLALSLGLKNTYIIPHRKNISDFRTSNNCATQYQDITEDMRQQLMELNKDDIELYKEALRIRKEK